MEALTSIVSPPIPASSAISRRVRYRISASLLPPRNCLPATMSSSSIAGRRWRWRRLGASAAEGGEFDDDDDGEIERAMGMGESIPRSSEELVRRVSSRAYDMRRLVKQTIDSISYDVLETNPWREDSKPVYVLTQRDNQLWTMKTRRSRSEVETELGQLFSKEGKRGLGIGNRNQHSSGGTEFSMLVEDIREGILDQQLGSRIYQEGLSKTNSTSRIEQEEFSKNDQAIACNMRTIQEEENITIDMSGDAAIPANSTAGCCSPGAASPPLLLLGLGTSNGLKR